MFPVGGITYENAGYSSEAGYLDTRPKCDCGHERYASLNAVKVGEGALNELSDEVIAFL